MNPTPPANEADAASYHTVYADRVLERRDLAAAGVMIAVDQSAQRIVNPPVPDLVIGVGTRGAGRFEADLGRGRFKGRLGPDQTILIPPGTTASLVCEGPHSFVGWSMSYAELLELTTQELGLPNDGDFGRLHAGPVDEMLAAPIVKALWAANSEDVASGLFNQSAVIALAGMLTQASRVPLAARTKLAPWQLKRAIERIESGYAEDISLNALAAEVRLSPFHFLRAFRHDAGCPPHTYLLRVRVERAKSLLETSDLTVTEIAARVGYAEPGQLTRIFRREARCTPREYRKRMEGAKLKS